MAWSYHKCATAFAGRRRGNNWKRLHWCTKLWYDERKDCYEFQHHNTITVRIFPGKYQITPSGWYTVTTKKYIWEMAGVSITERKPTPLAQYGVYAGGYPFEDGDEFDAYTKEPLVKRPFKVRQIKVGARREWAALRHQFMLRLQVSRMLARILIGEFDPKDEADDWVQTGKKRRTEAPSALECLQAMQGNDLSEALAVLLVPRPQQTFGRVRYGARGDPVRPAMQRLQSALAAARRAFYQHVDAYYYAYPEKKHGRG